MLHLTGLFHFARWQIARRGGIVVLTFHRVLPDRVSDASCSLPGMIVRQSTFDSLLSYLCKHFEIVDLNHIDLSQPSRRHRLRLAITFDDGWADNYAVAQPIARKYGVPITIFICSQSMGSNVPPWPEMLAYSLEDVAGSRGTRELLLSRLASRVGPDFKRRLNGASPFSPHAFIEYLKSFEPKKRNELIGIIRELAGQSPEATGDCPPAIMSWSEARVLSTDGVAFGSHTRTHEILTQLTPEEVKTEVYGSKSEIEERLPGRCRLFAYPNGNCTGEIVDTVRDAGYEFAFTTQPGYWRRDSRSHLIPRINVWEGKLIGRNGKFSVLRFEYSVLWKAFLGKSRVPSLGQGLMDSCL